MTNEQIDALKTKFVNALVSESLDAYAMGQQNCPGPISLSDADAIVSNIFNQALNQEA